jgi:outer membrane lipoprotein-sorting protein
MDRRKATLGAAIVGVAAGAVALGLVAAPAGAGQSPVLPATTPTALVQSVLNAKAPAMSGTVEVDNNLGLPAVPGLPQQAADGKSQIRVWTDGNDRSRIALPSQSSEQTIVDDGTTVYAWDSADRSVVEHSVRQDAKQAMDTAREQQLDPATAAKDLVQAVRATSTISVDGTDMVADRPAYDLVLTPKPSERTLLREVRIAVDSQTRVPLRLTVLANNTDTPAVQIGFTSVHIGPQDPALFRFTVPAGATVTKGDQNDRQSAEMASSAEPKVVGTSWDTVIVAKLPGTSSGQAGQAGQDGQGGQALNLVRRFGTPVHGTWGSGWVIGTDVGNALITSDGRVAAGFVPQQVLFDALGGGR